MQWFKRLSHLNGLKCEGRRKLWTERRTDGGTENWTLISRLAKAGVTKMQEFSSLLMTHRLNVMHAPVKFHEYISYHLGVSYGPGHEVGCIDRQRDSRTDVQDRQG